MKLVINECIGGFGLSYEALKRYIQIKDIEIFAVVEENPFESNNMRMVEYKGGKPFPIFSIHYTTKPLVDGKFQKDSYFSVGDIERNDPALIQVVEEMKDKANGDGTKLEVVEIPDEIEWQIEECNGIEWVAEAHRKWC